MKICFFLLLLICVPFSAQATMIDSNSTFENNGCDVVIKDCCYKMPKDAIGQYTVSVGEDLTVDGKKIEPLYCDANRLKKEGNEWCKNHPNVPCVAQ